MEIETVLVDNIARIKLRGRLDTQGVDQIETKFTASVVPARRNALVDLSEVSFITSMGLRMFIAVAKALARHKAKMVLFAPQSQVSEVFTSVRLAEIIPIARGEAEATQLLTPQAG
ncbi:MAG TPA: STAS domain-containing protein [Micropepsaceae bacterium]|nr:STAS domain-containing protein [Micropepsaceae bacterium]